MISGYLITGGLHIDGLMDTFDGIFAGKRKMLKAMKDSQVGSFGVLSLVLTCLVQFASLSKLQNQIFFVLPICLFWGRLSTLVLIDKYKYISKKKKSISHKKYWRGLKKESFLSVICLLIFFIYLLSSFSTIKDLVLDLILFMFGIFTCFKIPIILGNKIDGFNGDLCGASVVLVETIMIFIQ